jgi:transposase
MTTDAARDAVRGKENAIDVVRYLYEVEGLSLAHIGRQLGYSRQYIHQLKHEAGMTRPSKIDARRAQIPLLIESGKTGVEIAKQFRVSKGCIQRDLAVLELAPELKEKVSENATAAKLRANLGRISPAVKLRRAQIPELVESGMYTVDIANHFQVTIAIIYQDYKAIGLTPPRRTTPIWRTRGLTLLTRPYGRVGATLPRVHVEPRILEELKAAAQRAGTNTSDAVRQILGQWVAGQVEAKGRG